MAIVTAPHGYTGVSTDTKPDPRYTLSPRAAGYVPAPKPGHKFIETDTLDTYTWVGDQGWQRTV